METERCLQFNWTVSKWKQKDVYNSSKHVMEEE